MVIRQAEPKDLENIAALYVRNHKTTYRGLLSDAYLNALTTASALTRWEQTTDSEENFLLVAEQDGVFLGFAAAMPDPELEQTLYLESLHVSESARGKGIGTALIRACAQIAAQNGFQKMSVCIVRGNNSAAKLYQKLGAAHHAYFEDDFGGTVSSSEKLVWSKLPDIPDGGR